MHSTRTHLIDADSLDERTTLQRLNIPERLGDYTLGRELGRGGMGVVFEAVQSTLDRKVAVKILPGKGGSDTARKRFEIEARATAQLNHPNIVPLYHVGCDSGTHFYVMKLIDGIDLGRLIRDTKHLSDRAKESTITSGRSTDTQPAGSFDTHASFSTLARERNATVAHPEGAIRLAKAVAHVGIQAADALAHAHDCGIVHRDIKPSNLLFDTAGNIWVADFGLAHFQNASGMTKTGDLVGTLRYMSPEQASGRRDLVDHRTDIYSLGIALYELATLQHACRGTTVKDILREITFERPAPIRFHDPRLPKPLETIICKATERNPADRYQSAADLAADLKIFASDGQLQTRRTPRWKHARDWLYQRPGLSAALVALLLIFFLSASLGAAIMRKRLTASRASELLSRSAHSLGVDADPSQALELAVQSHQLVASPESNAAILSALSELREFKRFDISESQPGKLAFSPDGRQLLKCQPMQNSDYPLGEALVFDLQQDAPVAKLKHVLPIFSGAFSQNGKWMATSGYLPNDEPPPPLVVWNAADFRRAPFILGETRAMRVSASNFSPGVDRLVVPAKARPEAIVFQLGGEPTEYARLRGGHEALLVDSLFSPDGRRIVTVDVNGHIALWDATTGNHLTSTRIGTGAGTPSSVGKSVVEGVVKTIVGPPISEGSFGLGSHVEFSPDSSMLLVSCFSGTQAFDAETLAKLAYVREPDSRFSASGASIICRGILRTELLSYDVYSGEMTQSVVSEGHSWNSFALPGDGTIACCYDLATPSMQLVDFETGKHIAELTSHQDLVEDVAFRPGTDQFASASWDGTLRLWNIRTDSQERTIAFDVGGGLPVTLSEDGQKLVVGSRRVSRSSQFSLEEIENNGPPRLDERDSMDGFVVGGKGDGYVIAYDAGQLKRLDSTSHRVLAEQSLPSERTSLSIVTSNRQSAIMVVQPGRLVSWDFDKNSLRNLIQAKVYASACAADPTNPSQLLVGTTNGKLLAFDADSGETTELLSVQGGLSSVDIAEDGKTAALLREGFDVMLYDINSKEITGRYASPDRLVACQFLDNRHVLLQPQYGADAVRVVRNTESRAAADEATNTRRSDASESVEERDIPPLEEVAVLEAVLRDWCATADAQSVYLATSEKIVKWDWLSGEHFELSPFPASSLQVIGNYVVAAVEQAGGANELQVLDSSSGNVLAQRTLNVQKPRIQVDEALGYVWVSGNAFLTDTFDAVNPQTRTVERESNSPVIGAWKLDDDELLTVSHAGDIRIGKTSSDESELIGQHEHVILTLQISPDRHQLLTSDANGITRQWDIPSRLFVRKLNVIGPHSIGDDNFTVVSSIGSNQLGIWDLRSGKVSVEEFKDPIVARSLSTTQETLLVVTGSVVSSVRSAKYIGGLKGTNQLYRLDIATRKRQRIEQDETIVDCIQLPDGNTAQLDLLGRVRVKTQENRLLHQLTLNENVIGLHRRVIDNTLFAHTAKTMIGWDLESGERKLAIPLGRELGTRRLQLVGASTDWFIVASSSGIHRVPRDPAEYAAKLVK